MYEIKYEDGKWWIYIDGEKFTEIGGFIDPITPEIIVKEILDDKDVSDECAYPNRTE